MTSDITSNIHSSHLDVQRIDIVYGIQNIGNSYSQLFLNAKIKIDNCINCYNLLSYFELESIKKSIIEAHGGKIWGKNNNDDNDNGIGAEFGFTLPIE